MDYNTILLYHWQHNHDENYSFGNILVLFLIDCKMTYVGSSYNGRRTYTISGRICQRWDKQRPHSHSFVTDNFPDVSVANANNYCRNPDNHTDGPWCYTIDPDIERESCGIKLCMQPGMLFENYY
jgi:hypothetical protein